LWSVGVAVLAEADLGHLAQELALVHAVAVRPFVRFVLGHPAHKFSKNPNANIKNNWKFDKTLGYSLKKMEEH
jgi:hypothetical protein